MEENTRDKTKEKVGTQQQANLDTKRKQMLDLKRKQFEKQTLIPLDID